MSVGPNVVFNCPCGHKEPPHGTNDTCQPVPGKTCGGPANNCPLCWGNNPPAVTPPAPQDMVQEFKGIDVSKAE